MSHFEDISWWEQATFSEMMMMSACTKPTRLGGFL
jgi:hypothetical protein